jgi:proton-dependent oligopeptide transporter, POT family
MSLADILTYSLLIGAAVALAVILKNYAGGLRGSPRDMWFLFLYFFVEYVVYAAMNTGLVLWLSRDCGLGDVAAGSYIAAWSMMLSIMAMTVGALVDTIGIKRTLILSIIFLLISRFFMSFVVNPVLIFIFGFIPLAIGFAIVGPLISVAIKRYTTKDGAALGFALFYVIMNIAYAVGGVLFDKVRDVFALREAGKIVNENFGKNLFGVHFSTYQILFLIGIMGTMVSLCIAFLLRDGVEMTPEGIRVNPTRRQGSGLAAIKTSSIATGKLISAVVREKYFWTYIGMLGTTVFVRGIFFHFHYTFPKYGIRVLGEGAKIGNIYGVLNPVLIVFLVPLVAAMTKKVSSYRMMIVGSIVSSLSCFIVAIPPKVFASWTPSVLGEMVFIKWLHTAPDMNSLAQNPPSVAYWPLIVFIAIFTIGESIWSPRLMQFTAEIAPKGKEGTYIALSILPWFLAKFLVGPMSGILVKAYTPLDAAGKALPNYPQHQMVWVWIGGVALLTPLGLVVMRGLFNRKHTHAPEGVEAATT